MVELHEVTLSEQAFEDVIRQYEELNLTSDPLKKHSIHAVHSHVCGNVSESTAKCSLPAYF